jgi:uncharacterized protein YndB with AHSA1/START domain
MARIQASIEIHARPREVFRFCHDLARRPEWDERVMAVEMITPPPLRTGSVIRIDAGHDGQFLFTWDAEYLRYYIPTESALRVLDAAPSSPFKTGTLTWRFEQSSHGTRFTIIWEYQPRGFLARIGDALGRRHATQGAIQHSLKNVKNRIESGE